jgi:hypothetical protein
MLLELIHDHLVGGQKVTLSLGISIEPLDALDRATWSYNDTAALLLALQVDIGAMPRPTVEDIRASWFQQTNKNRREVLD